MRVLHLGNVAQNGYNNAKFLRRLGVETWAVCDEEQTLAQPEWEEAPLPDGVDAFARWTGSEPTGGWRRPDWVIAPRVVPRRPKGWYRAAYTARLHAALPRLRRRFAELRDAYEPLRPILGTELTFEDVRAGFRAVWMHSLLLGDLPPLFRRFDVVQAYATHTTLPLLAAAEAPMVAFEHGTMRELPFEDSWRGRLLALSYRLAPRVIITNVDVISSARRLELDNFVFVPHPVDESRYTPGDSRFGAELHAGGAELVLLAPARQDWREKANDVLLRAFAKLDHPTAVLVVGAWGADIARSRSLAAQLGVERRVVWMPPVPKHRLIDAYRGADIVLDQFVFGTFGGIAPEAMAIAKPVVMRFDATLHEWAFPQPPPIVDAADEQSLAAALARLGASREERERLGAAGRDWVERHHGWRLVAGRQLAVYEEVLARTGAVSA